DSANEAILTDFTMSNCNGLIFSQLEFSAVTALDPYFAFRIESSSNIEFRNLSVHGDQIGGPAGFLFRNGSNIRVINSDFQQLGGGIVHTNSTGLTITGNSFHDIQSDGISGNGSSNVEISQNTFTDFHPVGGDHPDAIQFFTLNTTAPAHDITITNNT